MNAETALQNTILAEIGASATHRLWRNATGLYHSGHVVGRGPGLLHLEQGDVVLRGGHPVHAGLCPGSSDLVGLLGPDGRFLGLEVKTATGRAKKHQRAWLQVVRDLGGIAGVVKSVEDVQELLRGGGHGR